MSAAAWALAVGLMLPGAASESHAPVPPADGSLRNSDLLSRKLAEAEAGDWIQKLLKNLPNMTPGQAEQLRNLPSAPDILRRLRAGDPELLELAEKFARSNPQLRNLPSDRLRQLLKAGADQLATADVLRNIPPLPPPAQRPPIGDRERATQQAYAERLNDLLRDFKLEGAAVTLRESQPFQEVLRELAKAGAAPGPGNPSPGLFATLGRLDGLMKDARRWLPANLPRMSKLNLKPLNLSGSLPDLSAGRPSLSLPAGLHDADLYTAAVGIAFTVFTTIVLWRVFGRKVRPVPAAAALGPWPVDPGRVSTRDELIRAFEYLALLRCGPPARHWHHHRVAARLAEAGGDGDAAATLAGLYERVRYAPAGEPAAGTFEAARAALGRLAGSCA